MPHILQVNQLKQWTCPQSPGLQTTGWKLTLHLLGTHHYFLQPWRMLLGFIRVIQRDYTRKRTVPMETTENMFTICSDMWYLSSILSSETSNIYAIINFKLCDTTRVDAEDPDTPLTIALRQLWPPSAQCFSHMCTEKNHREGLPAEILFPVGLGQAFAVIPGLSRSGRPENLSFYCGTRCPWCCECSTWLWVALVSLIAVIPSHLQVQFS